MSNLTVNDLMDLLGEYLRAGTLLPTQKMTREEYFRRAKIEHKLHNIIFQAKDNEEKRGIQHTTFIVECDSRTEREKITGEKKTEGTVVK